MRLRAVCAMTGLAGLVGLACTLSRWPWALTMLQIGLILVTLTAMRLLSAQRAIGLSVVAAFAGAMTLLPMSNFIYERITRDLKASLDHRAKDRRVALEIFGESPLLGVGLNNYSAHVIKYDPEMEWALENEDVARTMMNVRVFAALHNFYLFLLAESGIIGLTALLFFFFGVVRTGARAVRATDGNYKPACLGLLLGILGVLAQGFVDFSLWIEPILYSFVLAIALLASAPVVARARDVQVEGVRA
jgi:O-antigen ligase